MKTKAITINTEYTRTLASCFAPEYDIINYHIEDDRTIRTRVGWNVRMILNAVDTEGNV